METNQTALSLEVPVNLKAPSAWSGGEHDGSRLTPQQRAEIMEMLAASMSDNAIALKTKHSRNTIAALRAHPARAEWLQRTRAARHLAREESLMLEADEVIGELRDKGKLKLADLTSAQMTTGIAIQHAGGSAPQRIRVEADPSLLRAVEIFSGQFKPVLKAPVMEAEIIAPASLAAVEGVNQENAELHRPCEAGSVARSGSPAKRESSPPQHEVPRSPAKRGIDQALP